jgi:hypothetical protein
VLHHQWYVDCATSCGIGLALANSQIVPWVVWGFFKLITPFIDPLTKEKLKFNEDTSLYVPAEQLSTENGGKVTFEYDQSVYWPALTKLCAEKRAQARERWEKGGKRYGESESYIRGGAPAPGQLLQEPQAPAKHRKSSGSSEKSVKFAVPTDAHNEEAMLDENHSAAPAS